MLKQLGSMESGHGACSGGGQSSKQPSAYPGRPAAAVPHQRGTPRQLPPPPSLACAAGSRSCNGAWSAAGDSLRYGWSASSLLARHCAGLLRRARAAGEVGRGAQGYTGLPPGTATAAWAALSPQCRAAASPSTTRRRARAARHQLPSSPSSSRVWRTMVLQRTAAARHGPATNCSLWANVHHDAGLAQRSM